MGSRSEFGMTVGGVHSFGYRIVWCAMCRRSVLGGRVANRLRELIVGKAAERGGSVEAPTTRPTKARP